jgi:hypothetical protein
MSRTYLPITNNMLDMCIDTRSSRFCQQKAPCFSESGGALFISLPSLPEDLI